jgi:hypothetical protein
MSDLTVIFEEQRTPKVRRRLSVSDRHGRPSTADLAAVEGATAEAVADNLPEARQARLGYV